MHTANGVIQIDLKRSNPTLIVNGHPLLQYQQTQQQYQQQQHQGSESINRGANYFPTFSNRQPESSVVYQSVQGESDADSLAASKCLSIKFIRFATNCLIVVFVLGQNGGLN